MTSLLTTDGAGGRIAAMSRQPRVEYPGASYHLMSRGDRQQDICLDDVDRHGFLRTLAETCQQTDCGCTWGVGRV